MTNPSDSNFDGCVQLNDLLDLLSAYGDCGAEESPWQCGDPLEYQGYDYETVQIGEQCWFAENLRAENYRNGDPVESELQGSAWANSSEGAFQSVNDEKLYNWFAVIDERQICPSDWSVSSDDDWLQLEVFLGIDLSQISTLSCRGIDEGDLLKAESWGGSDLYGFEANPAGLIQASNGDPFSLGTQAQFWTSTAHPGIYGYDFVSGFGRELSINASCVMRYIPYPQMGASIRCIKDTE